MRYVGPSGSHKYQAHIPSNTDRLTQTHTTTYGHCGFTVSRPVSSNSLSPSIHDPFQSPGQFCHQLNTFSAARPIGPAFMTAQALKQSHYLRSVMRRDLVVPATRSPGPSASVLVVFLLWDRPLGILFQSDSETSNSPLCPSVII